MQLSKLWECEVTGCSKLLSQWEKLLNTILRAKLKYMKNVSNEMNSFLQCRRQIFRCFSFFAEKVILELKCTNPFFRASKNTNSVFKSKAQVHDFFLFLMKWTVFCNAEDRFSWVWAFLQKKVILELKCTKSLLYSFIRTPILCFSATKQIMRMRGHRSSKLLSQ